MGGAFNLVPDKNLAWQDLHRLTGDEDSGLRSESAEAIGAAFNQVPDKNLAWQDLHRLTQDENRYVRMEAYHSLGRSTIFKATEAADKDAMKKELEAAIVFFEKSI
jgi:HEAT repeat protein